MNAAAHSPCAPAGFGTSLIQQWRLLAQSGRWLYLCAGLLSLLLLILLLVGSVRGTFVLTGVLAVLAGAIWPVMVWHAEGPRKRAYFWSLPVHRPAHELARVAAGVWFLLLFCALLAGAGLLIDFTNGTFDTPLPPELASAIYGWQAWVYFFGAPLTLYMLVMPLVLWSDYPIVRRVLLGWIALTMGAMILDARGIEGPISFIGLIFDARGWGLANVLLTGIQEELAALAALALWLLAGAALTSVAAYYRPDDLRLAFRHLRRARP